MNTCDKCKWWALSKHSEYMGMRQCKLESEGEDKMMVAFGEPFNEGVVVTGPKFGCIHWELKRWKPSPEEVARMEEGT